MKEAPVCVAWRGVVWCGREHLGRVAEFMPLDIFLYQDFEAELRVNVKGKALAGVMGGG